MPKLALFLFGLPRMEQDGLPVEVDTRKAVALMSYLAVTRQAHSREHLARLLWGESDPSRGRAALRRTLSVLNKALSGNWLQITNGEISLVSREDILLDVQTFVHQVESCVQHGHGPHEVCDRCRRALETAVSLYRGGFLTGFQLADSPAFDDWQFATAQNLHLLLEQSAEKLSRYFYQQGETEPAIRYTQQWAELDALQEEAHRRLMQLYAKNGQLTAVHRQYQKCVDALQTQLKTTPQPETTALYEQLTQAPPARLAATAPPPSFVAHISPTPIQQLHNLSMPLTPCMGRETELKEILKRLADPFCRLLTISGPGGVGKTRLAMEVAHQLLKTAEFTHGIYFIPLASVHSADFLPSTIAQTLNIPLSGQTDPKRQLLQYFQRKQMLLLLDNFEHLLPAAPLLLDILQTAPGIKLLVTSRECLNFHAEWLFEISGLSYPPAPKDKKDSSLPHAYSAIQLFLYNIAKIQPGFTLNTSELVSIIRICGFVSGFPLGIELASTLMRHLSSQQIADQLEHTLDPLTTSMPDIPERHRSLRTVFEFSWNSLTLIEQSCFKRLSIFRGQFSSEAAQQVAGATSEILTRLLDKSLLRMVSSWRYEIHELIKLFAREKLQADTTTLLETQSHHARHFAQLMHQNELHLRGELQKKALETIGFEIEEIRAAWEWANKHQKADETGCLIDGLYTFYETHGWYREGVRVFQETAVFWQNTPAHQKILSQLQARQASFLHRLSRYTEAQTLLEHNLATFRQLNLPAEVFFCLHQLSIIAFFSGNYAKAQTLLNEGLNIAQTIGDEWGLAHAFNSLGNVFSTIGDHNQAKQHFQTGLVLRRKLGDHRGIAVSLNNLGRIAETFGEDNEAKKLFRESITIKQSLGDKRGAALSTLNLGYACYRQNNLAEAKSLFQESLATFREIGEAIGTSLSLTNLGNIAYTTQQYTTASQLYEESLSISTEVGDKRGIVLSLNDLGNVAQAIGRYEEAKERFCHALKLATEINALPLASEALIGLAAYQITQNQVSQALEFVCFVRQQVTNDKEIGGKAENLYHQLLPLLSPKTVAMMEMKANNQTLHGFIQQLETICN